MNMRYILSVLIVLVTSCTDITAPPVEQADLTLLLKSWTHSREEQTDSIQIYRPSDYKEYPMSWFRGKYKFYENGTCEYLILAPNDGHYWQTGTWSAEPHDRNILHIPSHYGNSQRVIRVIELNEDIFRFVFQY